MLHQCTYNNRNFHLSPSSYQNLESKNLFTIIVGKNGTGKSRLFQSIINDLNHIKNSSRGLKTNYPDNLVFSKEPTNIIAVSISPFDKFPLENGFRKETKDYNYLGLRDLYSQNMGKSYMSKITFSLLKSLLEDKSKAFEFMNTLKYLGYKNFINLKFEFEPEWCSVVRHFHEKFGNDININMHELFQELLKNQRKRKMHRFFNETDDEIKKDENIRRALEIIFAMRQNQRLKLLNCFIDYTGLIFKTSEFVHEDNILFLLESGILKLNDVELQKNNSKIPILISEASSGEQSVIMSILGITSKIKHGSLICIDEPEVCLHPEWQEKYITLIINAFSQYKDCHFLIATHSPLIVANLENDNCFILSMEDGSLINASNVNHRSVDFQLANIFKTPGFKNEYLSRELLSFLTLYSEGATISVDLKKSIKSIIRLKMALDENDPVLKLVNMSEEVLKENFHD